MSWFSRKEKEQRFVYTGIRESKQFRNEIDRFIELEKYFQSADKIYTLNDLSQISKVLSESNGQIDVFEAFIWRDESENQTTLSENLTINTENFKRVSVSINNDLLNFLFFQNEDEKNRLVKQLNQVIIENEPNFKSQDFKTITLFHSFEKMFGTPPSYLLNLFVIETSLYTIWHTENTEILNASKRFDYVNSNFNDEIKKDNVALKWNLENLKRKISYSFGDISKEENTISALLLNIKDYNINPMGYEILNAIVTLGLYYAEKNPEKAFNYFDKANCNWSNISNNTASFAYKQIGEAYLKLKKTDNALMWFKKGLELNPKLTVKNIIKEIEGV
jgi:tetratricopeptide (TPR) repeat protein